MFKLEGDFWRIWFQLLILNFDDEYSFKIIPSIVNLESSFLSNFQGLKPGSFQKRIPSIQ